MVMIRNLSTGDSRGVALVTALFVLLVMTILGVGMLMNVYENLKISKNSENSERALKVAEAGVQIARASFFDPKRPEIGMTQKLFSVDGFIHGGYFLTRMVSGFAGNEKWVQWHYDAAVTGYNTESKITSPVRRVWATSAPGQNGAWDRWGMFNVNNLYGIVARGLYFPIETNTGSTIDTKVRAHNEFTGVQDLGVWKDDKVLTNAAMTPAVAYAAKMSPMSTFSNYSTGWGDPQPTLLNQTLYFTYAGSSSTMTTTDQSSTVRLRAANARCNGGANNDPLAVLWEFDTGLHGFGTAPAFFDPDPKVAGNEIVYFTVVSMGTPGSANTGDILDDTASNTSIGNYPAIVQSDPEQIYLFAVVDTVTNYTCGVDNSSNYIVKWAHPFPDPDVADWTDYPIEVGTGTDGTFPPYISKSSDIVPYPPEDDLVPDYRDSVYQDNQQNQVRADIFKSFAPQALAPAVVQVLYRDSTGKLTDARGSATEESKADPIINLYLTYATTTRLHNAGNVPYFGHQVTYAAPNSTSAGAGWGVPGDRKQIATQARVAAIRDWVVKSDDPNKAVNGWDWTAAKSRFPSLKWVYRVVGNDPDQTDQRPPQGYGEYTWDTWFCQQVAPMIRVAEKDQDHRLWQNITGAGKLNVYPVIYPIFKNSGFPNGSGKIDNPTTAGVGGPNNTTNGAVSNFSTQNWTDARVGVMAIRDTWEDYLQGNQTNPLYADMLSHPMSNPSWSNPVEPYWTHTDGAAPDVSKYKHPVFQTMTTIQYNDTLGAPYVANADKIGFPRPYLFWEALWTANVLNATSDKPWGIHTQGWAGVPVTVNKVVDTDVEGETCAICNKCLGGDGLMVFVFNHDLCVGHTDCQNQRGSTDMEDLRIHGINATTGIHQWDYHSPSSIDGDNANGTPAIANGEVFAGYMEYGAETNPSHRNVHLVLLSADRGTQLQDTVVDNDADAIILSPTIANGVVYVGTLDMNNRTTTFTDDVIRVFAMSPTLRLESTGIYPMAYRDRTLVNYTSMVMDKDTVYGGKIQTSRRKLQVLVSGGGGKWQEVRDEVKP
jgi:hypothetical protein